MPACVLKLHEFSVELMARATSVFVSHRALRDAQPTGDDTSPGAVLFVANAEPLALTLIKWLYLRLVHVHDKTPPCDDHWPFLASLKLAPGSSYSSSMLGR